MTGREITRTDERVVAWAKDEPFGAEYARVGLTGDSLRAVGVAIGSDPVPYRLTYDLVADDGYVTDHLCVTAEGEGWWRMIALQRAGDGSWTARTSTRGGAWLGAIGGDMARVTGALDADLGLSPMFNSMPVLRHGLLNGGQAPDMVMAWISVPDLAVHPSEQRYISLGRRPGIGGLIRFEGLGDGAGFTAEIVFDHDGLVVDYPGIARRLR